MTMQEPIFLGKLTRREFRRRMESGGLQGCIIPVGAVEQHLEHLAMEHDWRSVRCISEAVADRFRPRVLVVKGLMAGISEHHMNHPGTLSLRPATFLAVLEDMIDSMVRGGFRHILVLNGHGGNMEPCRAVWDQFLRRCRVNLHFLSYWDLLTEDDARDLLRGGHRLPEDLPGHAQEFETSIALAAFPANVRGDACADQSDSAPALATAETGRAMLERIVARVAHYLDEMLEGRKQQPVPPCYP
jgi:creatinine amidohydrolase